jgi:predicted DNA-binding WGR domain protein
MAKKKTDAAALLQAVDDGDLAKVKTLVEGGMDPNQIVKGKWAPFAEAVTALHLALLGKAEAIGKWLLARKETDVNAPDSLGRSPLTYLLFFCAGPPTLARAKALLARGADPNLADEAGCTALFGLTGNGRTDGGEALYDLLVGAGADTAHKNEQGHTALDCLFHELRVGSKKSSGAVARLIAHMAKTAKSRYTKDELALAGDPMLWMADWDVKAKDAPAVIKARLAIGRVYGRAGFALGAASSRSTAYALIDQHGLPGPSYFEKGKEFREVAASGATVVTRAGKLETEGQESVEKAADAKAALARAEALVAEWKKKGFQQRVGVTGS